VRCLGRKYGIDTGGTIPQQYLTDSDAQGGANAIHFDAEKQVLSWTIAGKQRANFDHMRLGISLGTSSQIAFDRDTSKSGQMTVAELNQIANPQIDLAKSDYTVWLTPYDKKGLNGDTAAKLQIGRGYSDAARSEGTTSRPATRP
jgi:hypothetical protein